MDWNLHSFKKCTNYSFVPGITLAMQKWTEPSPLLLQVLCSRERWWTSHTWVLRVRAISYSDKPKVQTENPKKQEGGRALNMEDTEARKDGRSKIFWRWGDREHIRVKKQWCQGPCLCAGTWSTRTFAKGWSTGLHRALCIITQAISVVLMGAEDIWEWRVPWSRHPGQVIRM